MMTSFVVAFFFLFCFFFDLPKLVKCSPRILEIRVQAPVATDITIGSDRDSSTVKCLSTGVKQMPYK